MNNQRASAFIPVFLGAVLLMVTLHAQAMPFTHLEEDAAAWGGYEEGQPTWVIENTQARSPDGQALRCGLTGGTPYSNIHCYRNLPADPDARFFTLALDFYLPDTTHNNQNAPSLIQALEFTMNQWQDGKRHEWALQWMNVGAQGPQWRYWDPHADERWVALNITDALAVQQWHTLRIEGAIQNNQTHYRYFVINGRRHPLNITVTPFETPDTNDKLAVAVQADGNYAQEAYDLLIDNVNFYHTVNRRPETSAHTEHNTESDTGKPFRFVGNTIYDPAGNPFILRGVNIFPWHDAPTTIDQIAGCWQFNTVRLHAWILPEATDRWKDHVVYIDEPLLFDPATIEYRTHNVRHLIEAYTSRGIVVLFDVHDLLGQYFQGEHLQAYLTFIADFAEKFKDNPYVWLDLHNEPGTDEGLSQDFSQWRAAYTAMRDTVRAIAPDMPLFASGNAWGQDTGPRWHGEPVITEESALLSNADFFTADSQLAPTLHVYDQWNYGSNPLTRLQDYVDRVRQTTRSPLLIGEYGYEDNHTKATDALHQLLQQPDYRTLGRIVWAWEANDHNDLTTDTASHGSGAQIDSCTQPGNLSALGQWVWNDNHRPVSDYIPSPEHTLSILLPLYKYPTHWDPDNYIWDDVAAAQQTVDITAIINPHNGPGETGTPNSDYQTGLDTLRDAGVTLLGYVSTCWANSHPDTNCYNTRSLDAMKRDIHAYATQFNIHGIFFDEAATSAEAVSTYEILSEYARSLGLQRIVVNPGITPDKDYVSNDTPANIAVTFESPYAVWQDSEPDHDWITTVPARQSALLVYDVPASAMTNVVDEALSRQFGYLYLTDDGDDGNPWDSLPTYWQTMLDYIAASQRDTDGDGVVDTKDAFPDDPTETTDTDSDGIGNNADPDDDGDRIPDDQEHAWGMNPLDASDALLDNDGDGVSNVDEYLQGRDPTLNEIQGLIPVILKLLE